MVLPAAGCFLSSVLQMVRQSKESNSLVEIVGMPLVAPSCEENELEGVASIDRKIGGFMLRFGAFLFPPVFSQYAL